MASFGYNVWITKPGVDPRKNPLVEEDYFKIPRKDIRNIIWSIGHRSPATLGYVAIPGVASIVLNNESRVYQRFGNTTNYDKAPGARIHISVDHEGRRISQWNGWAEDQLSNYLADIPYIVNVIGQGALGQMNSVYDEIFTFLEGESPKTGEAIRKIIQASDWPFHTSIDDGNTRLDNFIGRLNKMGGLFNSGEQRTSLSALDAIQICVQAELGRVYDNHIAAIVFEDRLHRASSILEPKKILTEADVKEFAPASYLDSIINEIQADSSKLVTRTRGALTDSAFVSESQFPHQMTAGPSTDSGAGRDRKTIYVNRNEGIIRYTEIGDIVHDRQGDPNITVLAFPDSDGNIELTVLNFHDVSVTVNITSISGRGWTYDSQQRGRKITRRHDVSIRKFGKKSLVFPASIVDVDDQALIDHLQGLLNHNNGIFQPEHLFRPDLVVNANLHPEYLDTRVSDVIRLQNIAGFPTHDVFVDQVEHRVDGEGNHDIIMLCSDVRNWTYWLAGTSRLGMNNRVAW